MPAATLTKGKQHAQVAYEWNVKPEIPAPGLVYGYTLREPGHRSTRRSLASADLIRLVIRVALLCSSNLLMVSIIPLFLARL